MKEAVILAGGRGTRLQKLISDVPKPMAPVNGKPFLYYVLLWLEKNRIERVIISSGYKAESIVNYFGNSFYNLSIDYATEAKPLGTGGAVRFAFRKTTGDEIIVINGDTYFPIDLERFYLFHTKGRNLFSIALKRMKDFSRYGSVEVDGNAILRFNEKKQCTEGLINGGIYLVNRQFIESQQSREVFSLEKDFLEAEAGSGNIKGIVFDDPFIDIGMPEDYLEAQALLKSGSK